MGSKPTTANPPRQPNPPQPPFQPQIIQYHNPIFETIINEKFPQMMEKYYQFRSQDPPQDGEGSKEVNAYYYLGIFKDGKFHDLNGILIMIIDQPKQIEIYQGQFKKGIAKGYGELRIYGNDDFEYKGRFENNQQNDQNGFERQKDFNYTGNFVNGKKHGFGKLEKKEQYRILNFEGVMENDQMYFGSLTILNINTQSKLNYRVRNGKVDDTIEKVINTNRNELQIGSDITQNQEI